MQEVKFRAWDPLEKIMCATNSLAAFALAEVTDREAATEQWKRLIPLQYIGMKDVNGVEVYQGDLIASQFQNEFGSFQEGVKEVIWCPQACGFFLGKEGEEISHMHWGIDDEITVVGNVYQNPELLEKDDENNTPPLR